MTLIDHFLAEHPFFCSLLEHERRILSYYLELYRCPKNSYLVLPNELQEVLWIVVRGRLAEYTGAEKRPDTQREAGNSTTPVANEKSPQRSHELDPKKRQESGLDFPPDSAYQRQADQPTKLLLRYFCPGDLINVHALTQELIAQNEIVSLEEETQVICMTAFHMAKLAQQQPRIHRTLRPVYNEDGHLVSGLPLPVWQQMGETPPPHTRDLGRQWHQRKPLLRSYNSWYSSIFSFLILGGVNIWQIQALYWETVPFLNGLITLFSAILWVFVILLRYRSEYTLKHSLLHITDRSLLGLSSKIKSYPLLSIRQVELISVPLITRFLRLGGIRILTYQNEIVQIFPIDRPDKWLEALQKALCETHKLQDQLQHSQTLKQFQKWHKLQPELIKEIHYHNTELEGRLERSLRAFLLQISPVTILWLISLYYSLYSELLQIYLTIPLISLSFIIVYLLLRWTRYTWRISEEYLLRQDNFRWQQQKIPLEDIQDIRLEYLNILGFGNITLRVNGRSIRLLNLKNPQNILDEIESLRQSCRNPKFNDFLTHKQLELYQDFQHRHVTGK